MGMASDLMRGVSGDPKHVAVFRDVAVSTEQEQEQWIAGLRAKDVKAAHPDDGWVDRDANTVYFCYPQFNDGAGIGALQRFPTVIFLDNFGKSIEGVSGVLV